MGQVTKVIRTHGRAGQVHTLDVFPDAVLCVSESQLPLYREHYPKAEYLVHGDDVVGLAPKMQWMMEQVDEFVSLDDDIAKMVSMFHADQPKPLDPDHAAEVVDRTADHCREMGAYMFGWAQFGVPAMMQPHRPFRLRGIVGGHAMGLLAGHDLYVHPDANVVDDYWLSALNAYKHRMVFVDERYYLQHSFMGMPGGLSDHRTLEVEKEATALLRRTFGSAIAVKSKNPIKQKHQHERSLRVPW